MSALSHVNVASLRVQDYASLLAPDDKRDLTALTVCVMVLGLLGVIFAVCGFTPLAHTWHRLLPLYHLGWKGLTVIVVSSGFVAVTAIAILIFLHKKPPSQIQPEILHALENVDTRSVKQNIKEIKKILEKGYSTYLDLYGFYYQLSLVTEKMSAAEQSKEKWRAFLKQLHGTKILHSDAKREVKIDCSIELGKLDRQIPQLKVEEWMCSSTTFEQDLENIYQICLDAFPDDGSSKAELRKSLFDKGSRPFVIRNNSNGEILAVIALVEIKRRPKKKIYIHTLARRAHAVKLGITEKLKDYLLENIVKNVESYETIYCTVLKDNKPALYLYEKLGFKVVVDLKYVYIMHYLPKTAK